MAAAGGWKELAVALEDGSIKGGSGCNKRGNKFGAILFLSLHSSHLLTFHFSLLGALEKAGQKKKSEEERLSIFYFSILTCDCHRPCYLVEYFSNYC